MTFSFLSMRYFQVIMQMTQHLIFFKNMLILKQSILKQNVMFLQKWFHGNYIVLNPGKCYYMTFGLNTTKNEFVLADGTIVLSAEEYAVSEITIYSSLTFYSQLNQLCKKVANKPNV